MPFRNNKAEIIRCMISMLQSLLINCSNVINITCFERRNFLTSHKTDFFLLDSSLIYILFKNIYICLRKLTFDL